MTKLKLIETLSENLGTSKKLTKELVDTVFETIIDIVKKEGKLKIQGFGTFKISKRKARVGINPRDPERTISIPAVNVVTFKAGKTTKREVN